jgi:DNA-binding CsgD family transcriptional regulator
MSEVPELSRRELEIIGKLVTGATNREIARSLSISHHTVKVHLRNVYQKLGVASRTEATHLILTKNLLESKKTEPEAALEEVESETVSQGSISLENEQSEEKEEVEPIEESEGLNEPLEKPTKAPVSAVTRDKKGSEAIVTMNETGAPIISAPLATHADAPISSRIHPSVMRSVLTPEVLMPSPSNSVLSWVAILLGIAVVVLLALVVMLIFRSPPTTAEPSVVALEGNIQQLDPSARWQQLAQLPTPLKNSNAIYLGGDLLLIGGESNEGIEAALWRYDGSQKRWQSMAPIPEAVRDAPMLFSAGKLLVVGGIDQTGKVVDIVQHYDPETNQWHQASVTLPHPLARSALASFEGTIFLFGGWDGTSLQDTIYRYLADEQRWELYETMPTARADLAAATVQDGIVLIGGTAENEPALDEVLYFAPYDSPSFAVEAPLPTKDAAPKVVTLGNALYLFSSQGTFLERGPSQEWKELSQLNQSLPQNAALVASDPYIIFLGGESQSSLVTNVWQYQAIYRSFIPITKQE